MKFSTATIKEYVTEHPHVPIIYFWGHTPHPDKITRACLSQWYDCRFAIEGIGYHTTEQYMMASKARLFGDEETLRQIMLADHPSDYKNLGRLVKGFVPETWDAHKYRIVVEGNRAKFSQNAALQHFLLSTDDAILAEASPYDTIWGIGLGREVAEKGGVEQWRGQNLLGCALMEVRSWLKECPTAEWLRVSPQPPHTAHCL